MLTLNMIQEALDDCSFAFMPSCRNKRFGHLGLLPSSNAAYPTETIYCGGSEDVRAFLGSNPSAWVMCISSESETFQIHDTLCERIVFCRTKRSIRDVYAQLQELFFTIESWVFNMKNAVLEGGDYQSLLNCSEAVFKNFISVSNSEFKLLAYTKHIEADDPIAREVVRLGFHPPETIERFKRHNIIKDWENQTRIEVKPAGLTALPTMDYIFRMGGSYFLHVVMHCKASPASPGLIDKMQLLVDHIEYCAKQDWNERFLPSSELARLFNDLISHRITSDRELLRRLGGSGISPEGSFSLAVLMLEKGGSGKQLLSYYAQRATESFEGCLVATYSIYVVVLDPHGSLASGDASQLRSFANLHPCTIGISDQFTRMQDFAIAFQQAKNAIELATMPSPSLALRFSDKPTAPLYRLNDRFALYVATVAKTSNHLVGQCVQNGIVAKIARYDEQHDTNDLKILYVYLANERKASAACDALFLHRSTLLYRVEKMQERFGFSLNDLNTRQRIMAEYLIYAPEPPTSA